jgi:hypothetical protein
VSILQDLVFAVRKDVNDLHFRLEHLDQCVEKIESLLVTLLCSLHAPELETNAPATSEVIFSKSIWLLRVTWTSANVKHHESWQVHMCHHACFTLSIVNVFWRIPLRPLSLAQSEFFCLSGDSLFGLIVFMNGLVELVSLRGDSENVV